MKSSLIMFFWIPYCNKLLRNYYLLSFTIVSKKNIHNYLKKLLKPPLFFNNSLCEAGFYSYTSTKTMLQQI